jgi:hypothetical protein
MAVYTIMVSKGSNRFDFNPFMCFVDRTENALSDILLVLDASVTSCFSPSAPEFAWDDDPALVGNVFVKTEVLAGGRILRIKDLHINNNASAGYWPYSILLKKPRGKGSPGTQESKGERAEKHPVIINR